MIDSTPGKQVRRVAPDICAVVRHVAHLPGKTPLHPVLESAEIRCRTGTAATPAKSNPHSAAKLRTIRLFIDSEVRSRNPFDHIVPHPTLKRRSSMISHHGYNTAIVLLYEE